jgi:hypothetical protein
MNIQKKLEELIETGSAFVLSVTLPDGSRLSYSRKAEKPKKHEPAKELPTQGEIESVFNRFDSMSESERIKQGVWKHKLGIACAIGGSFVKSFRAKVCKVKTSSCYMGKGKVARCYLIPRPSANTPATESPPSCPDLTQIEGETALPPPPHAHDANTTPDQTQDG